MSFTSRPTCEILYVIKMAMARLSRIVIPNIPHHVTQRGNRRQQTFFDTSDYEAYIHAMAHSCNSFDVEVLAYCLMPNHVHLVLVPKEKDCLRFAVGGAHEKYTKRINYKNDWTGHLWQGRFFSSPMDERYLGACVRYVEQNPVRSGLSKRASEYKWSSAKAHYSGKDDKLVSVAPMLARYPQWAEFMGEESEDRDIEEFRKRTRTGRPLGDLEFIKDIEEKTGVVLRPKSEIVNESLGENSLSDEILSEL